jgi:broad-specificity NMP kinase
MSRVCILGGPRTGKTTLAKALASDSRASLYATDDLITLGIDWSQQSERIATWFDEPGPWVVEGVAVPRALRKWLAAHATEQTKPCDAIYVLNRPHVELSKGQDAMTKAVKTVWKLVEPELLRRGVEVRNVASVEPVSAT